MSYWSSFTRSTCTFLIAFLIIGTMGFVMAAPSEYNSFLKGKAGLGSAFQEIRSISQAAPGHWTGGIIGNSDRSQDPSPSNGTLSGRPQWVRRVNHTPVSGSFREQLNPPYVSSRKSMVTGNGTVLYVELEGGFYGIVADDGSRYIPDTLPDSLKINGTRITFSGIVTFPEPGAFTWGSPLHAIRIIPLDDLVIATGTVRYIELEGGFYGIVSDDGNHYLPLNLPEEYRVDGLVVTFTAREMEDINTIYMWGIVVQILSVTPVDEAQKADTSGISGTWTLVRYLPDSVPVERIPGTTITAEFGDEGKVIGRSGCNLYFAEYETTGQTLSIRNAGSTEMFCYQPEGTMEQEAAYLDLLGKTASFEIDDGELILMDHEGRSILWFVRGNSGEVVDRDSLVGFRRTGGFAGFNDRLVVYSDGTASLSRKEVTAGFTLSGQDLQELEDLLMDSGFPSLDSEYKAAPGSADLFMYEITYEGKTVTAEETAVPESLVPVIDELSRLIEENAPTT